MRPVAAIAAGTVAGLAIFSIAFAVWMVWGADPKKDGFLSFVNLQIRG